MTTIRKRTKITSIFLAFALALTMGPGMAFAEELPISKANGTVDVAENNNANPHHTDSCDGTDGNSEQDLTTCKSCGESFFACQINDACKYLDEEGNEVSADDENVYEVKFVCPACGESLMEGEDTEDRIQTMAANTSISLTVPIVVTFGGASGYDVSNPLPCIEAPTSFRNAGKSAVMITKITTAEYASGKVKEVLTEAGSSLSGNNTTLENQTLYSLYPTGQPEKALNMKYKDGSYDGGLFNASYRVFGDTFTIGADSTLDCTYRLNLTNSYDVPNANAKVKPAKADKGQTVYPLSRVTYTITTYAPAGSYGTTVPTLNATNGFYLKDSVTGQVYNADDVKGHAQDISKNGKNSLYYGMYAGFVYRYRGYECKTYWNNTETGANALTNKAIKTNIIGILHDNLSDGSGKAGLTFQSDALVAKAKMNSSSDCSNGWGAMPLRASMNSGAIYGYAPADIKKVVATVNKEYGPTYSSNSPYVAISQDKFFLVSSNEVSSTDYYTDSNPRLWVYNEGYQYEYYSNLLFDYDLGSSDTTDRAELQKSYLVKNFNESACAWYFRSVSRFGGYCFSGVYTYGNPSTQLSASTLYGVAPCFCL
ncbi:DUF6273 domain-containing protein [Adlercreutzia sp. ZJ304]|uniref:DUF6273 domain-containing protein n=1 Tax=Adlercreutzia sp. ZJ304 TaxID=2709791 RepID=UPI0013EAE4C6|nr:DUF6273 domain-containing protein [Adlercreutzia sp. ZJ304]